MCSFFGGHPVCHIIVPVFICRTVEFARHSFCVLAKDVGREVGLVHLCVIHSASATVHLLLRQHDVEFKDSSQVHGVCVASGTDNDWLRG